MADLKPYIRKVYYYETDLMGCVHHSNYIRYFEELRVSMFNQIGLNIKKLDELGYYCPVVSVQAEYKSMLRFDDEFRVEGKVLEYNGITLVIGYEIYDNNTNELKTTGTSKHCFVTKAGKIISLKKAIPEFHEIMRTYC